MTVSLVTIDDLSGDMLAFKTLKSIHDPKCVLTSTKKRILVQRYFVESFDLASRLTHAPAIICAQVGDDYARIVVNAQKKQLARFGSTASSTRRGPQTQREQPVLPPPTSASGMAATPTVDAFRGGASAASAAELKQGQSGADI